MPKNDSNPIELTALDELIKKVVENSNIQAENFNITEVENSVKIQLRDKIISEVCKYKKNDIIKEAKKQIEDEKKKSSFASIKQIMWEGFVLALIVGLLVNEASYLIQYLKELGSGSIPIIVTVILIIVFAIISLSLYIVKFTKDIIDKFIKNKKK